MQGTLLIFETILLSFLGWKRILQPCSAQEQPHLPAMDGPTCPFDLYPFRRHHGPELPPVPLDTAKIVRTTSSNIPHHAMSANTCPASKLLTSLTSPASVPPRPLTSSAIPSVSAAEVSDAFHVDAQLENLFVFAGRTLVVLALLGRLKIWEACAQEERGDAANMARFMRAINALREKYVDERVKHEMWRREVVADDLRRARTAGGTTGAAARNIAAAGAGIEAERCLRIEALVRAGLLEARELGSECTLAAAYEAPCAFPKAAATVGVATNKVHAIFIH